MKKEVGIQLFISLSFLKLQQYFKHVVYFIEISNIQLID